MYSWVVVIGSGRRRTDQGFRCWGLTLSRAVDESAGLADGLKVSSAARKIPVERRGVGRVPGAQGQCQGQAYPGGGGQAYRQPGPADLDVLSHQPS